MVIYIYLYWGCLKIWYTKIPWCIIVYTNKCSFLGYTPFSDTHIYIYIYILYTHTNIYIYTYIYIYKPIYNISCILYYIYICIYTYNYIYIYQISRVPIQPSPASHRPTWTSLGAWAKLWWWTCGFHMQFSLKHDGFQWLITPRTIGKMVN